MFGPNSAGKSSLLSVLPMLAQTAARPDVLSMSGDLVEGGSFRMAVHCHDVEAPMTLGFGWTSDEGVAAGRGHLVQVGPVPAGGDPLAHGAGRR